MRSTMHVSTFAACLSLSLGISSVRSLSCFHSNDCTEGFVCDNNRSCVAPPISAANVLIGTDTESIGTEKNYHAHRRNSGVSNDFTNMFESGCLKTMIRRDQLQGNPQRFPEGSAFRHHLRDIYRDQYRRTCNSDDGVISSVITTGGEEGITSTSSDRIRKENCVESEFKYEEVRIAAGNWESSIVLAWIYQIVLSEVFDVPVTIEPGNGERDPKHSFYDPLNRFEFPDQVYPFEHLEEADKHDGNCNDSNKACAHIIPEVWDGAQNQDILKGQRAGYLLTEESNGMVGTIGYHVPLYTAERDPTLLSYIGLRNKREKLASTFKTPTKWLHYCMHISTNNCTDGTSVRYPVTQEEEESYFVEGLYDGHFRIAESNNCTSNPDCVGHVVAPPCTWSTYVESQMYWNNISVASGGDLVPNNGYTVPQMIEIYNAANATKSDVLIWWWSPEILFEKFLTTPARFVRVALPAVTEKCLNYRSEELSGNRCSADQSERIGEEIGSCDYSVVPLKKIMSTGIRTSQESIPDARQSPAYTFLKQVYIPEYAMPRILNHWMTIQSLSDSDDDQSREAVCEWVYDNLDVLLRYSPPGYPREITVKDHFTLDSIGYSLGGIAFLYTVGTLFLTYKWRQHRLFKVMQFNVLCSMLCGFGLVAFAAIVSVSEPSGLTCSIAQWSIRFGYTIQFVPVLIKFSAINKVSRSARKFRRVEISPHRFKRLLVLNLSLLFLFLITWTIVDHPKRHEDLIVQENGELPDLVAVYVGCASQSYAWELAALGWECFLVLAISVLAFQSRQILKDIGESQWLAVMVYSHLLLMLMRFATYVMLFHEVITSAMESKLMSVFLSVDTIISVTIYFLPKFISISNNKNDHGRGMHILQSASSTNGGMRRRRSYISGVSLPNGQIPNLIRPSAAASSSFVNVGDPLNSQRQRRISGVNIPEGGMPNLIKSKQNASDSGRIKSSFSLAEKVSEGKYSSVYMGESSDDDDDGDTNKIGKAAQPCITAKKGGQGLVQNVSSSNLLERMLTDGTATTGSTINSDHKRVSFGSCPPYADTSDNVTAGIRLDNHGGNSSHNDHDKVDSNLNCNENSNRDNEESKDESVLKAELHELRNKYNQLQKETDEHKKNGM